MTQPAQRHYRVMPGRHRAHAAERLAGDFIAVDLGIEEDFSRGLSEDKH